MGISNYLKSTRGNAQRLAARLGVSASLVIQWGAGKPVALERCAQTELATGGEVTCEQLRPDVAWHRVPDPNWPWHPEGRPLIDVARQADTTTQEVERAA